jgi:prepilin-type N-terminal cleavage/methylation domain-containing protein
MKSQNNRCLDRRGFTLVEIMCTLVIISVFFAVAFTKVIQADEGAQQIGINHGVVELNVRETVTWAVAKVDTGVIDDNLIWTQLDKNLGSEYSWDAGPNQSNSSTLRFKETAVSISRFVSTNTQPGNWRR